MCQNTIQHFAFSALPQGAPFCEIVQSVIYSEFCLSRNYYHNNLADSHSYKLSTCLAIAMCEHRHLKKSTSMNPLSVEVCCHQLCTKGPDAYSIHICICVQYVSDLNVLHLWPQSSTVLIQPFPSCTSVMFCVQRALIKLCLSHSWLNIENTQAGAEF